MNESDLWAHFYNFIKDRMAIMYRVEANIPLGIPDVHYVTNRKAGWIELKQVKAPKKSSSPVRIPHFTQAQRVWLANYGSAGGLAFILVGVGASWYLMSWQHAYMIGEYTQRELAENSVANHDWSMAIDVDMEWQKALRTRARGKLISPHKRIEVDLL